MENIDKKLFIWLMIPRYRYSPWHRLL